MICEGQRACLTRAGSGLDRAGSGLVLGPLAELPSQLFERTEAASQLQPPGLSDRLPAAAGLARLDPEK